MVSLPSSEETEAGVPVLWEGEVCRRLNRVFRSALWDEIEDVELL